DTGQLLVGGAAALGLKFNREAAAVMNRDDIGHAGLDAETLHDRGLDRPAIAAVCWMERKDTRRSAGAQMLKKSALDGRLGPPAGHIPLPAALCRSALRQA